VQDPRSLLRDYYAINGLPITLLFDKEGKPLYHGNQGIESKESLDP
jgi:hypothetical protein